MSTVDISAKPKPETDNLQSIDIDPDWKELQKQNMKLGNRELEARSKLKEIEIIEHRIENARRNLDTLIKYSSCFDDCDIAAKVKGAMLANIDILRETKNIK